MSWLKLLTVPLILLVVAAVVVFVVAPLAVTAAWLLGHLSFEAAVIILLLISIYTGGVTIGGSSQ